LPLRVTCQMAGKVGCQKNALTLANRNV
jgi:hypothetical protein